jgi:hypothetical protein
VCSAHAVASLRPVASAARGPFASRQMPDSRLRWTVGGRLRHAARTPAAGTAPSHWRDRPAPALLACPRSSPGEGRSGRRGPFASRQIQDPRLGSPPAGGSDTDCAWPFRTTSRSCCRCSRSRPTAYQSKWGTLFEAFWEAEYESSADIEARLAAAEKDPEFMAAFNANFSHVVDGESRDYVLSEVV